MPTKDSLSAPGSFRSGRAIVSAGAVDASAIGQGMKSAARGVGQIGANHGRAGAESGDAAGRVLRFGL